MSPDRGLPLAGSVNRSSLPQTLRRRRLMWLLLAVGLLALPFLSLRGRYVFDTRDPLWFDPRSYLARALVLWRSSPYLGHEQHDGIAVPMGMVVWLLRSVGLSAWVAERLWHGLMLLTATATTILLVDRLRGQRTVLAAATAGLVYSLTPYAFGYGLPFTGVFLPYVLLPLLLLITLRGVESQGLLWPALFGLTTFLMGGGNGAPQVYVLLTAGALVAWAVLAERSAGFATAFRFGLWSLAFFVGLNAYWLLLLRSSEVSNALAFSEQPNVINVSSSASEAIRGLGFWQYYGGDQFGSWIPAVRTYVTSIPLLITGFALPIGALLSAWLVRWRYRLFFVFLVLASVVVAGGTFPVRSPTPFGKSLLFLYDHLPGAAGLRTTYKVTAQLELAFALLAGFGLAALWGWLSQLRRGTALRAIALAAAMVVVGSNAYPLWTGSLYSRSRGVGTVPTYWNQALAALDRRDTDFRAFFAPATSTAIYRWGTIKDGVVAANQSLESVYPRRLPVGGGYGSNLVAAAEDLYFNGLPATGSAQLFRYLGVRDVVLQNDLDWQRSHTARPARLQSLLSDPDILPFATFGRPGQSVTDSGGSETTADPYITLERSLSPVQVLTIRNPSPMVRAEAADPIVLSGDGYGIAEAARLGLLAGGPPILYSGSLSAADLDALLSVSSPSFVVTDTNRRAVWSFTSPRAPHSYTLPEGQTLSGKVTGYELFGDRSGTQSVAIYSGLRDITASGYGFPFGASPWFRPANAFDGDPTTLWAVGVAGTPIGSWIQATFDHPLDLSRASVLVPRSPLFRPVQRVRLEFSDGTSVTSGIRPGARTTIDFPSRQSMFLRVRILAAGAGQTLGATGAAISDIEIPGLAPAETIQVPSDLLTLAQASQAGLAGLAAGPLAFVFGRARTGIEGEIDEEAGISRRFEVPGRAPYGLSGTVHLYRLASDEAIDSAVFGANPVVVTSSSRLFDNPLFRGSAALDANLGTAWVPARADGEWLKIQFPSHEIDRIILNTSLGPNRSPILRLHATFSDGSTVQGGLTSLLDGTIVMTFAPRITSQVMLTIDSTLSTPGAEPTPVGISEVHIRDVGPMKLDDAARMPCTTSSLKIDIGSVPVRPDGTVGDFLSGKDLSLATCDRVPVILDAGWHDLVARGAIQADSLSLTTPGQASAKSTLGSAPTISSKARSDGGYDVGVAGATGPFYLVIGQNFAPDWKAAIDGDDLGPPLLLDGYSAGWRISRTGSYLVSVRYGPQRTYTLAVAATGGSLAVALIVLTVSLVRGRRRWDTRELLE